MEQDLNTVKKPPRRARAKAAGAKIRSAAPPPDDANRRDVYHHGDLRQALIRAAEDVIRERGIDGFSLRETARRAGVSPAAPQHHFGDARGLLTAVATLGFEELGALLAEADSSPPDWIRGYARRRERIEAQGRAYVAYALAEPARFDMMWRKSRIDADDESYKAASELAYGLIDSAIRGEEQPRQDSELPDPRTIAAWAVVHGFARLALDGAFGPDPLLAAELMLDEVIAKIDL